jgi:Protein of unknown function (DUF3152)
VPARHVSRAALGAVVFACAAALAVLGLPAAGRSVGMTSAARGLGVAMPVVAGATDTRAAVFVVPSAQPLSAQATAAPPPTPTTPDPDAPTAADQQAGILRRTVPPAGGGEFDVAPGAVPAPGAGEVRTVRVEVERGLPVDRDVFAAFVLTTLNDPRGWGHAGTMSFARTDGDAAITVVLASPDTSGELCGDVEGGGMLSCRNGSRAVLTFQRWVGGTDEYAGNLTGYRQYVVNHEVGHALGHGHELCPGPGQPAPVMQQQTLGLNGCTQNSWPYP